MPARRRVLLEKLNGSHLVKKFPAYYGTQRFITAFASARHLSLSWATYMCLSNTTINISQKIWTIKCLSSREAHLSTYACNYIARYDLYTKLIRKQMVCMVEDEVYNSGVYEAWMKSNASRFITGAPQGGTCSVASVRSSQWAASSC